MESLPPETIQSIYSYLEPSDVAYLRLQSKATAAIGSQYLVPKVTLYCFSSSMQRLRDISEHRVIARHVQRIVWNIRVIKKPPRSPQLFKREFGYSVPEADENASSCVGEDAAIPGKGVRAENPSSAKDQQKRHESTIVLSKPQMKGKYRKLRGIYGDQERCLRQLRDSFFRKVFYEMPRLLSCELIDRLHECGIHPGTFFARFRFLTKMPTPILSAHTLQMSRAVLEGLSCRSKSFGFLSPINVLKLVRLNPRFLEKESGSTKIRYNQTMRSLGLEELNVDFVIGEDDDDSRHPREAFNCLQPSGFPKFLASTTTTLRELRLFFFGPTFEASAMISTKDALADCAWPLLRHFDTCCLSGTVKEYMDFFLRQPSLECFHFYDMALDDKFQAGVGYDDWASLLKRMRDELSLKDASFIGYLTIESEAEIWNMEWIDRYSFLDSGGEDAWELGPMVADYVTKAYDDMENPLDHQNNWDNIDELHAELHEMMEHDSECSCGDCSEYD